MVGKFLLGNDDSPIIDDRSDDKLFTAGLFGDMIIGSSNSEIIEEEEEEEEEKICSSSGSSSSLSASGWERLRVRLRIPATIKEELHEGSVSSSDHGKGNNIYVAVGKTNSSIEALRWALKNLTKPNSSSTFLYLIHVFPELRFIPSPLGRLPKDKVRPEQVNNYMELESVKRSELIQKFKKLCSAYKVKVTDTLVIESDDVAKAVVDLVLILNIKQLVLGTTKPTLRKVRRANGIAGQILKKASDTCEIRVICDGKEVVDDDPATINGGGSSFSKKSNARSSSSRRSSTSSSTSSSNAAEDTLTQQYESPSDLASFNPTCTCFTIATKFVYN